jgi:hypothetical protein
VAYFRLVWGNHANLKMVLERKEKFVHAFLIICVSIFSFISSSVDFLSEASLSSQLGLELDLFAPLDLLAPLDS